MNTKMKQGVAATVAALTFSAQILPGVAVAHANSTPEVQSAASSAATSADSAASSAATSVADSTSSTASSAAPSNAIALGDTTSAASNASASDNTSNRALGLLQWGTLQYVGMANNAQTGLVIDPKTGTTSGVINLKYDIQSVADVKWGDKSEFALKLPQEFASISSTPEFKAAITGRFRAWTTGLIKVTDSEYRASDIRVENNTIYFTNPKVTNIIGILPHVTIDLSIDLGKAVTDSGIRIPNAQNGYYQFQGVNRGDENVIDWNIGSAESKTQINIPQLDPGYGDEKPEINTDNLNTNIPVGSKVDDARLLDGVTAWDKEDGNVTNKLQVERSEVNPEKEGYYDVTYSVTDSVGLKTTKTVEFHVQKATVGDITPDQVQEGATQLTGTYTGAVDHLELWVNNKKVETGGILKDGKFTFYVPATVDLKKTDYIELRAFDENNNKLDTKRVSVTDKPATPSVSGKITSANYATGSNYITGSYTGDIKYAKVYVNGREMPAGGDFNNGSFQYYIGNQVKAGDVVKIEGYSADYQLLDSTTVTISGNNTPSVTGSFTSARFNVGDSYITGTYTGDIKYAKVYVNGKELAAGGDFNNGSFQYYVGGQIKAGDTVTIEGYSADYQKITSTSVTVSGQATQPASVTSANYTVGDDYITGTYTGDVAYAKVYVNGELINVGGDFNADGTFKFYAQGKIKKGDNVKIDLYSSNYQYQNSSTVSVSAPAAAASLTPATYHVGDAYITGSYTGDAYYAALIVNGQQVTQGGDFANGQFKYYVGSAIKAGDNVQLAVYSHNYELLNKTTVNVVA